MRATSGCIVCLAIALGGLVSRPAQAESGRPSRQALEAMGLGSLAVMSDEDAMAVRGQGYHGGSSVRVFGNSMASIDIPHGGAMSEDSYVADGKHFAKGSNSSFAGVANIWIDGHGGDHRGRGDKNMHGDRWGGTHNGDWGGKPGDGHRHSCKPGGHGHVKIHATVVFAGGHSSAWAF